MPELPEVETVRRGLEPVLVDRTILHAETRRADLRWPFPARMAERLTGARTDRLWRRSKYLLADLSTGETLIVHLGMSGRLTIASNGVGAVPGVFAHTLPTPKKHDHVVLEIEGGARITFNDARRFGIMDLAPTAAIAEHRLLAGLGPEPLSNAFDEVYLTEALGRRNLSVKLALMDQRLVAGLGNIYACEVLFRAGISPQRSAGRIAPRRVAALVPAIREVLSEAIAAGGSSLRDYRQAGGELGYFQHSFRVYGREGEICVTPGCGTTIRRIVQGGRSTFYCPQCQR